MTNNNVSDSSLYVKATNKGAYFAYFLLGYEYNFEIYRDASPYILAGESYQIPIPYGSIDIWFHGIMWPGYLILSSGVGVTERPLCYEFYGTAFNASCERIPGCRNLGDGSDSNGGSCCCNPCNCCCNSFCK